MKIFLLYRFGEASQYIKKIISRGDIGHVYFAKTHAISIEHEDIYVQRRRISKGSRIFKTNYSHSKTAKDVVGIILKI